MHYASHSRYRLTGKESEHADYLIVLNLLHNSKELRHFWIQKGKRNKEKERKESSSILHDEIFFGNITSKGTEL